FSEKFSRLSADDYVKQILVDKLNVRKVVVGYDHRFGRNRTASLEDMYNYADIYDFEVIEIDAKKIKSTAVNSKSDRPRGYCTRQQLSWRPFYTRGGCCSWR
ncbi:MAG: hypothetical protein ACPF9C_03725, partial [Flavobacteriaceae bacterium]